MILSIEIQNFRSIRDKVLFPLTASSLIGKKDHPENVIVRGKFNVLSTAVLYGRNASGKSNVLLAIRALEFLIYNSASLKVNDTIEPYEPFVFDVKTKQEPVFIAIDFLAKNDLRYRFEVSFDASKIHSEKLEVFPRGKPTRLYEKTLNAPIFFGSAFKGARKKIEESLLPNQLFLSKAASDNIPQIVQAFEFFSDLRTSVAHGTRAHENAIRIFAETYYGKESSSLINQNIRALLRATDTNVLGYTIKKNDESEIRLPDNAPDEVRKMLFEHYQYGISVEHRLFEGEKEVGLTKLDLESESLGTQQLFLLGSRVVGVLTFGGVLVADELDKSLHPLVTRLLIGLFQSTKTNPRGAQLIFSTHDTSLLDNELFRRDQIWFVEKDFPGATSILRLSDFSGVRKSTPFEKWYLHGKFGGTPVIGPVDLNFGKGLE